MNTPLHYKECEIVIEYAATRPHHETLLLAALDRVELQGTLCESNFGQGRIELCIELTEYPDLILIEESITEALRAVFGEPAVKHSTITLDLVP